MGVAPEKAIKLMANDTMRDLLRSDDGSISLWKEVIAGGTVGGRGMLLGWFSVYFQNMILLLLKRLDCNNIPRNIRGIQCSITTKVIIVLRKYMSITI